MKDFRAILFYFIFLGSFLNGTLVWSFEYGQCLLAQSSSYNQELGDYRNVALAKAAIKKNALIHDPSILKWNFKTTKFIYNLIVIKPVLDRLAEVYARLRSKSPETIIAIQDYFSGVIGHIALSRSDSEENEDDIESLEDFIDFLEEKTPLAIVSDIEFESLKKMINVDKVKIALGDIYDQIQDSSVGGTPIEPDTINDWLSLAEFYQKGIIDEDCDKCKNIFESYKNLLSIWKSGKPFQDEKRFEENVINLLPPFSLTKYPVFLKNNSDVSRVVRALYKENIENFLFGRNGIKIEMIHLWILSNPNYKIILKKANAEIVQNLSEEEKIYRYIMGKERVFDNAFDHFVWKGQYGTEMERAIDGVARTLYGEAESCQNLGASQFEAIGSIISARAISVDQENQKNSLFTTILNGAINTFDILSPIEIEPLMTYKKGASDFGRIREHHANATISGMPTPAQVVSRPTQFSVWKLGSVQELEVSRWITWPKGFGYPEDMTVTVSGPASLNLDTAQLKVLCPNDNIFNKAVEIATSVVSDYYGFANRYRFYQGPKRVVPYFYTHGPKVNLKFVTRITPNPLFIELNEGSSDNLAKGFKTLPLFIG